MRLKNKKQFERHLMSMKSRIENALIYKLEYFVSVLENHAKTSGAYKDQTARLRSSIGGVVLKNGIPVKYAGFEGSGGSEGIKFLNTLLSTAPPGYAIIVVAGMDYASYVEDIHELNVLKRTELKMRRELPKQIDRLRKSI